MNIRKLLTRLVSLVLIAVFLPTVAMADTWYLEDGSITVSATDSGQNVSQGGVTKADSAPVIRNRDSSASTTNNVTIKADTGATANVTLEDTNIDTTGGAGPKGAGDAAVRTEGAGNVNLNVELDNTLQSGNTRAGVEKGNGGNLTIGSESGSGQLVAVGADGGAGIGSEDRLASGNYNVGNITITGGDIFATGNGGGAGIGGGWYCGASDITITGGNVTAVGKEDNPNRIGGAGIGGGGSQSSNAGGGSNLGGLISPFMGQMLRGEQDYRFIAVEPASCPSFTRGKFVYDFCDTGKVCPLAKMYTLGAGFIPSANHAGGLRYHGMSSIVSQLYHDGYLEARSVEQTAVFEAAEFFARCEGILPAPESSHAIRVAIDEAVKCKESGEAKNIVIGLTGTGYFDMVAYGKYNDGEMRDVIPTDEDLARGFATIPSFPGNE